MGNRMKDTEEKSPWVGKVQQPDRFQDNREKLEYLILKRNVLFKKWLRTHETVTQRREVAHEVKCSKNVSFQQKAKRSRELCGGVR